MKKKYLSMAVAGFIMASASNVFAAEADEVDKSKIDEYAVEETVVEAERHKDELPGGFANSSASVGILGNKDVMETPLSSYSITEKTLDTFGTPSQPMDNAFAGVPSVRTAGSILHGDFTLRGFRYNGTSMYVNGVHGVFSQFNMAMNAIERVDILSGPNSIVGGTGVQYESNTAGGIINAQTKRAGREDFIKYKQTFSGRSGLGEYIDISQRLGKDRSFGIRFNAEKLNGTTGVKGAKQDISGAYLNIDHIDKNSKSNLWLGYRDIDIDNAMRWFKLGPNVTVFPSTVNGSNNYGFPGMYKAGYAFMSILNHEQKVGKDWKVFFNGAYTQHKLNHNVSGQNSAFTITNNLGDYKLLISNGATPQQHWYAQIGTQGKFETGNVKHELTISFDKAWRNRDSAGGTTNSFSNKDIGMGNIYSNILNITAPTPADVYRTHRANKTSIWGVSLVDSMQIDKWGVILGIHKHQGKITAFNNDGNPTSTIKTSATVPSYALSYKPNDNVYLYASHVENFDVGEVVASGFTNTGEILPPYKTKQNEIGIKYQNKGLLTTLAFYDIKQANRMNVRYPGATQDTAVQSGVTKHRGIELSFNGRIAKKWNAMVGISWMNAFYDKNTTAFKNGAQESGQPRWTGSAAIEYAADNNFSVIGRMSYTGSSPLYTTASATNPRRFKAPSFTVFDLGVVYNTKINKTPVKLTAMCYNVANKDYWMVSRGDQIYVSVPRTFFISAEFKI